MRPVDPSTRSTLREGTESAKQAGAGAFSISGPRAEAQGAGRAGGRRAEATDAARAQDSSPPQDAPARSEGRPKAEARLASILGQVSLADSPANREALRALLGEALPLRRDSLLAVARALDAHGDAGDPSDATWRLGTSRSNPLRLSSALVARLAAHAIAVGIDPNGPAFASYLSLVRGPGAHARRTARDASDGPVKIRETKSRAGRGQSAALGTGTLDEPSGGSTANSRLEALAGDARDGRQGGGERAGSQDSRREGSRGEGSRADIMAEREPSGAGHDARTTGAAGAAAPRSRAAAASVGQDLVAETCRQAFSRATRCLCGDPAYRRMAAPGPQGSAWLCVPFSPTIDGVAFTGILRILFSYGKRQTERVVFDFSGPSGRGTLSFGGGEARFAAESAPLAAGVSAALAERALAATVTVADGTQPGACGASVEPDDSEPVGVPFAGGLDARV